MVVCHLFWFVWTTACFWVWKNILKVHNLERVKLYTNPDLRMKGIYISVLKGCTFCIFLLILFVCFNLVFVQNWLTQFLKYTAKLSDNVKWEIGWHGLKLKSINVMLVILTFVELYLSSQFLLNNQ